ncbi:MAG: hypothetical protein J2P24_00070 [Streptosporangiales bacterium]|nr:hypothetical protein [Streptosporangiales bacterium]
MTSQSTTGREVRPRPRVQITQRTLRRDTWWVQPLVTFVVLLGFVVYSTWAAFVNKDYFYEPYLSPFYSPCLGSTCPESVRWAGVVLPAFITPAVVVLIVPLGFRLTCYYYRKAYYRSFWQSPPGCAVTEPHTKYSGERRFPLILQNIHRYFFYLGLLLNIVLTYDAVIAFRDRHGNWGHVGLGTLVLLVNAALLWLYSVSCHACRHAVGGRLNHFSKHPVRYWFWTQVSKLNARHGQIAWFSLVWVALSDLFVRLTATGTIPYIQFF